MLETPPISPHVEQVPTVIQWLPEAEDLVTGTAGTGGLEHPPGLVHFGQELLHA